MALKEGAATDDGTVSKGSPSQENGKREEQHLGTELGQMRRPGAGSKLDASGLFFCGSWGGMSEHHPLTQTFRLPLMLSAQGQPQTHACFSLTQLVLRLEALRRRCP